MRDEISVGVELENRIESRAHTVVDAAPFGDPNAFSVLVDLDRARRAPGATVGHLRPALDGLIRVRAVVDRSDRSLGRGNRDAEDDDAENSGKVEASHRMPRCER